VRDAGNHLATNVMYASRYYVIYTFIYFGVTGVYKCAAQDLISVLSTVVTYVVNALERSC
jgi:hypothetical protein